MGASRSYYPGERLPLDAAKSEGPDSFVSLGSPLALGGREPLYFAALYGNSPVTYSSGFATSCGYDRLRHERGTYDGQWRRP